MQIDSSRTFSAPQRDLSSNSNSSTTTNSNPNSSSEATMVVVDHFHPDPKSPYHHGFHVVDTAMEDGTEGSDIIGQEIRAVGQAAGIGAPPESYDSLDDWAADTLTRTFDLYSASLEQEVGRQSETGAQVINYSSGKTLSTIRDDMLSAAEDPDHPHHETARAGLAELGATPKEREQNLVQLLHEVHHEHPDVKASRDGFLEAVDQAGEAGFNVVFSASNEGRTAAEDRRDGIRVPNDFYTNVLGAAATDRDHVLVVGEAASRGTEEISDDVPAASTPPSPHVDLAYHGFRSFNQEEQELYGRPFMNGTSYAAPAASSDLLKLRQMGLSNAQAQNMLINSAEEPAAGRIFLGAGVVPEGLY